MSLRMSTALAVGPAQCGAVRFHEDDRLTAPVLLIGAEGLVGGHMRAALGDRPVVMTSRQGHLPGTIALDVEDDVALRALVRESRPRAIVLAAAAAHVERCEAEPEATRRVNVDPARALAESARDQEAHLVVFSSDYVFDGLAGPYSEDAEVGPINEYGRQKVLVEGAAGAAHHLICRTSGVFGWEPRRKNFVCQLLDNLRDGRKFAVPSDQLITPTYAPDLADAVVELLDRRITGIVHASGPRVLGRVEFASLVARAFGLPEHLIEPVPTLSLGLRAKRPHRAGLRTDRLQGLLGRHLSTPEEALEAMRRTEPR